MRMMLIVVCIIKYSSKIALTFCHTLERRAVKSSHLATIWHFLLVKASNH